MAEPLSPDDPLTALQALVAQGRFQEAWSCFRRLEAHPAASEPEVQLLGATAALRLGRLSEARDLAASAYEGFKTRGGERGYRRAANLVGAVAFEEGRLAEAEAAFQEALRMSDAASDVLMVARTSNNLACLAHLRGEDQRSLQAYQRALAAYEELGDDRGMAETGHNLGLRLRQLGCWEDARKAAKEAVRHAARVGEPSLLALTLMGSAELEIERRNPETARDDLECAQSLAGVAKDVLGLGEVGRLRAWLALELGEAAEAHCQAMTGFSVADAQGSALLRAECAAVNAHALKRLGRRQEAEASRAQAVAGYRALGAATLLTRFERAWAAA